MEEALTVDSNGAYWVPLWFLITFKQTKTKEVRDFIEGMNRENLCLSGKL